MLIQNDDDFGSGISLPESAPPTENRGPATVNEIRYGFVPLAPRDIMVRPDAVHSPIPPAHLFRQLRQQDVEAEQFGTSLYFG